MEFLKKWKSLTWDDLVDWAGEQSVSRGRAYQRDGQVEDLAISEDGRLLATVVGGEYYSVSVWLLPKEAKGAAIESICTCPVGSDGCKHAVATVTACLDLLAHKKPVPAGNPKDPRWKELEDVEEDLDEDDEDEFDEDDYDEDEQDEEDGDGHDKRCEVGNGRRQRGGACGSRHGRSQDVVGQQRNTGDLRPEETEVVLGDDVGTTGAGVGLDRLAVGQDEKAQHHEHGDGDRYHEGKREDADDGYEDPEDFFGGIGR